MKLISAIVATAVAETVVPADPGQSGVMTEIEKWPGVSEDNTCGSVWEWQNANNETYSIVNVTCTWQPSAGHEILYAYADNGAFVQDQHAITGFESGSAGSARLRFFFENTCDNITGVYTCHNATCWEFTQPPTCTHNGEAIAGIYAQENVNDHRGDQSNWNLQLHGVKGKETVSINFGDSNSVTNVTCNDCSSASSSDSKLWTLKIDDDAIFGDLLQINVEADSPLNLWESEFSE